MMGGSAVVAGTMTSYTIEGLEEYITYSITVNATNDVGSAVSEVATVRTSEAGEVIGDGSGGARGARAPPGFYRGGAQGGTTFERQWHQRAHIMRNTSRR